MRRRKKKKRCPMDSTVSRLKSEARRSEGWEGICQEKDQNKMT
jgi:hypothetical protein